MKKEYTKPQSNTYEVQPITMMAASTYSTLSSGGDGNGIAAQAKDRYSIDDDEDYDW